MKDLGYVLRAVSAGKTIKFLRDFYGRHTVEIRTLWVWRERITLPDADVMLIKEALQRRRRERTGLAA
jgi:hypothetical protein